MNACEFSPCRRFRYSLEHSWDELMPRRRIMWVGLNPSTADEQDLDPTLRRIRAFSQAWGFNAFVMTNLFAFRATDPRDMLAERDPVGIDNDWHLKQTAHRCGAVVACWGAHGSHLERDHAVVALLADNLSAPLQCLGHNRDGSPCHPLYLPRETPLRPFEMLF